MPKQNMLQTGLENVMIFSKISKYRKYHDIFDIYPIFSIFSIFSKLCHCITSNKLFNHVYQGNSVFTDY